MKPETSKAFISDEPHSHVRSFNATKNNKISKRKESQNGRRLRTKKKKNDAMCWSATMKIRLQKKWKTTKAHLPIAYHAFRKYVFSYTKIHTHIYDCLSVEYNLLVGVLRWILQLVMLRMCLCLNCEHLWAQLFNLNNIDNNVSIRMHYMEKYFRIHLRSLSTASVAQYMYILYFIGVFMHRRCILFSV